MFHPSRLVLARVRRGVTRTGLAEQTNIPVRTLKAYEAGDISPSEDVLDRLATELKFPAGFFMRGTLDVPQPDAVSFRSMAGMTASQRDSAIGAAALAVELSDWIAARFAVPEPDVPSLRGHSPEIAADALRATWGLGERPIKNIIHLLEAHGVRVFSLAERNHEVDAFSLWRGACPFVFLNTMKSAEHSRFDAAHELGHLTLHRHGGPRGKGAEREADVFAASFLMPRGSVVACKPRTPTLEAMVALKRTWNVSVAAMNRRLHDVGVTTDWQYRSVCIDIATSGYRREEPNEAPRETSQVLQKVFHALRAEGVTRDDVARELCITADELEDLVFGLVMRSVGGVGSSIPTPRPKNATLRRI